MKFRNVNVKENERVEFKCKMKGRRCGSRTRKGTNCKNRVVIGAGDPCWQHRERDLKMVLKQSEIKGAGRGLFAEGVEKDKEKVVFKKGRVVGEYTGDLLKDKELDERYGEDGTAPYAISGMKGMTMYNVDAACNRGLMSMANGVPTAENANIKYVGNIKSNGKINIKATKDIKHGDELIANYGKEYFTSPMKNYHTTK